MANFRVRNDQFIPVVIFMMRLHLGLIKYKRQSKMCFKVAHPAPCTEHQYMFYNYVSEIVYMWGSNPGCPLQSPILKPLGHKVIQSLMLGSLHYFPLFEIQAPWLGPLATEVRSFPSGKTWVTTATTVMDRVGIECESHIAESNA